MKQVLISIQPYWVFLIIAKVMGWEIDKHKEIEVRKNYPKAKDWNKVAKIYCSKDKKSFDRIPEKYRPAMKKFLGKVIGHFVCDWIGEFFSPLSPLVITDTYDLFKKACLKREDAIKYVGEGKMGYAWHISDLVIYDEPRCLSEFGLLNRVEFVKHKGEYYFTDDDESKKDLWRMFKKEIVVDCWANGGWGQMSYIVTFKED